MKNPYMPMFWGDFFANTLHLTAQELGAYTALIGHAWERNGEIAVCDLQRVARVSNFNWHKVRPRLEQFFDTLSVSNIWIHHAVKLHLTKAAEISNKRKEAAMQMHSKSRTNGHANNTHLNYTNKNRDAFCSEGSKEPTPKTTPAEPKPVAEKKPINPRDPGLDYRSPPKTKSDNVLEPIPERPAFRRP